MTLTINERTHTYRLDGKPVPGVTTILGQAIPKPQLTYWAARQVAEWVADNPNVVEQLERAGGRGSLVAALKEVPWQKRDTAAVRGTDVHNLAERIAHGDTVEVPQHLDAVVGSALAFLDDWQPEPLVSERPVGHRAHWWAGTADMWARMPNGETWLFDYKTSSGVYAETAFQLAAYRHAEFHIAEDGTEQPVPEAHAGAVVHLRDDGYDVIPMRCDTQVYTEFRHMAFVAQALKRAKGNKTTPGYVGEPITPEDMTK